MASTNVIITIFDIKLLWNIMFTLETEALSYAWVQPLDHMEQSLSLQAKTVNKAMSSSC